MRGDKTFRNKLCALRKAERRVSRLVTEVNEMIRRAAKVTPDQFWEVHLKTERPEFMNFSVATSDDLAKCAADLRNEVYPAAEEQGESDPRDPEDKSWAHEPSDSCPEES